MISGGRFVNDVGGGISQFVTTMFNAVFFGGFEDVQHMAHMYYISRYPAGRESTVSYPQPDFRWKNDSKYGVLVTTSYTSTSVHGDVLEHQALGHRGGEFGAYNVRTRPSPSPTRGPSACRWAGAQGFSIDVTRVFQEGRQGGRGARSSRTRSTTPEPVLTCESRGRIAST